MIKEFLLKILGCPPKQAIGKSDKAKIKSNFNGQSVEIDIDSFYNENFDDIIKEINNDQTNKL